MKDEIVVEVVEKVELAIKTMSDNLGIAADKFYPIIVEQQFTQGCIWIGSSMPILLFSTFLIFAGYREQKGGDDPFGYYCFGIIGYFIFMLIFSLTLGKLLNPEYYAFMELTTLIN